MKQTLVIGSTVVDVLLGVPSLPARGQDVNITSSQHGIGGCAYIVYKTLRMFGSPALLCSPVGTGTFGHMVMERFQEEGLRPIASLDMENGCCYCLVEPNGERTFLSHHGAEYLFSRSWMEGLDISQAGGVYLSGIDVEEPTGDEMVDFVGEHPALEAYFSPGPRFAHIPGERLRRLLSRRDSCGKGPLLHLNEDEALRFSGESGVEKAAAHIARKTENHVVVTLGSRGCYCLAEGKGQFVPGFPACVMDTVGAGDTHCGALIAGLKKGLALEEACLLANRAGAAAVEKRGATLDALPDHLSS